MPLVHDSLIKVRVTTFEDYAHPILFDQFGFALRTWCFFSRVLVVRVAVLRSY